MSGNNVNQRSGENCLIRIKGRKTERNMLSFCLLWLMNIHEITKEQRRVELNSTELAKYGIAATRSHKCKFIGVFPADQIPKKHELFRYSLPFCYIVNTDPASEPGEHWVTVYHANGGVVEFFDSYGNNYDYYSNLQFDVYPTKFNTVSLQSPGAYVCGHYCLYFILKRSRGTDFYSISRNLVCEFNSNKSKIDNFIVAFVCANIMMCSISKKIECRCPSVVQCCSARKQL